MKNKTLILVDNYNGSSEYRTNNYNWVSGDSVEIPSDVMRRAKSKVCMPGSYLTGVINGQSVSVYSR